MSDNLPPGWEKKWNQQYSRYYYVNHSTKSTQWNPPVVVQQTNNDDLPPGWERKWNQQYARHYYVNHSTKSTQWAKPEKVEEVESSDSDLAASSIIEKFTADDLRSHLENVFRSEIQSKLTERQNFTQFYNTALFNFTELSKLKMKAQNGSFEKGEDLPVAESLLHAHLEAINREGDRQKSKDQIEQLKLVYQSFTDIEESFVDLAKLCMANEWKEIASGRPINDNRFRDIKRRFAEGCRNKVEEEKSSKAQRQGQIDNQKANLEELARKCELSVTVKVICARKGCQPEFRQLYVQNECLDGSDFGKIQAAIMQCGNDAKRDKEAEREQQKNQEKEKNESLRSFQEQQLVQLVDQLIKVNPEARNGLYSKAMFDVNGESIGDTLTQLKKKPYTFNKFAIVKTCLESLIEREEDKKVRLAEAEREQRAAEKQRKIQERKDKQRAVKEEKKRAEKPKKIEKDNPGWNTKEHVDYGHVKRCQVSGSMGPSVERLGAQGSTRAKGPQGPRVQRVTPIGPVEPRRQRLVPDGAKLAGQFEKLQAKGPRVMLISQ